MPVESFKAYGYDVKIFPLGESLTWEIFQGSKMNRHGFVRGTSKRSMATAKYRAREAAKLEAEG